MLQVQRIISCFSSANVEKLWFSRAIFLCGCTDNALQSCMIFPVIDSAPFPAAGLITRPAWKAHVTV